jgi:hypothetical protein
MGEYVYECVYVCVSVCLYVCMYVCMYIRMYAWTLMGEGSELFQLGTSEYAYTFLVYMFVSMCAYTIIKLYQQLRS